MSLELIVQHPAYKHLLKFANSVEAREKLLRLLQYFVRFLRYWKFRSAFSPEIAQLLPSLQQAFTLLRKPLRILKPLNHLSGFSACVSDQLSDPILRYGEAIKQLGLFLFLSCDIIQLGKMLGLLGGKGVNEKLGQNKLIKNINKYAGLMWSIALIGGIAKNIRQFQIIISRWYFEQKKLKNNVNNNANANANAIVNKEVDDDKKIHKLPLMSLSKIRRDFVKNVFDLVIASNMYGTITVSDGLIGPLGMATSVIAIQDLWNSCR